MKTLNLVSCYLANEERKAAATNLKEDTVVIFRSPNGETDWVPIRPEEHPVWIKNPHVLGHLLRSEDSVSHPSDPGAFYTAFLASEVEELTAASNELARQHAVMRRAPRLAGPDGKPIN